MKNLYIIAGANGSGKSTVASVLLPSEQIEYVNPDDIARIMCPSTIEKVRIAAGKAALQKVDELLNKGASFAVESTLSGKSYVKFLQKARNLGYTITIAYVFVDDPAVCIERIKTRVKMGGHNIPNSDVKRRYHRSKRNFVEVYQVLCDHWMLYYNGGTDLVLVAHGNGEVAVLDAAHYAKFMEGVCQK